MPSEVFDKLSVKEIVNLLDRKLINGSANITGGGIGDNIERVIPKKLCARIDLACCHKMPGSG